MVQYYACGTFLPKHQKWCKPRDCGVCGRVFRGGDGPQNCTFCLDPKNKKRVVTTEGIYVNLLDKQGNSVLDPKTGLVM